MSISCAVIAAFLTLRASHWCRNVIDILRERGLVEGITSEELRAGTSQNTTLPPPHRANSELGWRTLLCLQPIPTHPPFLSLLQARVVPTTDMGVIDFFLDTEMQEMEYEIARFRPRLSDEFFDALRNEMGNIRFAANASEAEKEKLAEL